MSGTTIGTAEWGAEQRAAREARKQHAREALTARHVARCDAPHDWLMAPCPASRVTVAHIGAHGDTPHMPRTARALVSAARRQYIERTARQAVMSAARATVSAARDIERASRPAVVLTPTVRITEPNSTRTAPQPHDALTAIEAHVLTHDAARRGWEHIASSEPNRDGRGTVDSAGHGVAVNGTEVRAMPRWTSSKRSAITTQRDDGTRVAVDWGCYRVERDGTRVPLVSTTTARKRKRNAVSAKQAHVERTRAIAGTLGVESHG
jgi:hypothetical protein